MPRKLGTVALDTPRYSPELARHLPPRGPGPAGMSLPPRSKTPPGVLVRALVSLGAIVAIVAAVVAYVRDPAALGPGLGPEFVALVVVGALTRRYGIALPGNGLAAHILGVRGLARLDRGWQCAALVAPVAMAAGDL